MNRIILISNIVLDVYWGECIAKAFAQLGSEIKTACYSFEEIQGKADELKDANFVVVCLNFVALYPDISADLASGQFEHDDIIKDAMNKCMRFCSVIKANTNAKIVWFGFEEYCFDQGYLYGNLAFCGGIVDKINASLSKLLENEVYIDFKRLIAEAGISICYDRKNKYRWNAPYSKTLISMMADEVYKQFLIYIGKTKKCLILDCDNVLWGGILSEDGTEGIQISGSGFGRPFQDFQRFLLDMYYHGVILAVCSKNDESDVLEVFREHSGMLLKQEHICCFRCNWNDKPRNIKEISKALNIGLDSIVFVDDSRFEIEAVRAVLPEVTTVLYHRDTIYRELSCFNLRSNIDLESVKTRFETYKTDQKREALKANTACFDDYLVSLNMKIDIHRMLNHEISRASELTQRTNKCTNGVRYTPEQLKERLENSEYEMYTVCVSDRFSDLGLVGIIGICGRTVDLFSLSCRALGRKVEDEMLLYALSRKVKLVRYLNTNKNGELKSLLTYYGLRVVQDN